MTVTRPLTAEQLGSLFQAIDNEPTGKLSAKAKIAGLDLAEDYIGSDLSGADLSQDDNLTGINLYNANLSNANLSKSNLSDANLVGTNLTGANFTETRLEKATFEENDLSKAKLTKANLTHANLSNAQLTSAVNLQEAILSGANLSNVKQQDGNLSGTNLENANLSEANLRGFNFANANLKGANLKDADLSGANLENADLTGANLSGANLTRVNLRKAILCNAILDSAELIYANLNYANLSNAKLRIADMRNTKLRSAKLEHADLRGAYLHGANLSNANLTGAYLTNAIMMGVNGTVTNLTQTTLIGVNLTNSIFKNADFSEINSDQVYEIQAKQAKFVNCLGINDALKNTLETAKGEVDNNYKPKNQVIPSCNINIIETSDEELQPLIEDYCQLAVIQGFDGEKQDCIRKIFEAAENNNELDQLLNQADKLIHYQRRHSKQKEFDDIASRILLNNFLHKTKEVNPNDINPETFKTWVKQLKLSDKFLEPYIDLLTEKSKEYKNKKIPIQIICQTDNCSIGVMLWQPGVSSGKHPHGNVLDVIRVHKGTLSNTTYANKDDDDGEEKNFSKDSEVFINRHNFHDMKNSVDNQENLITIHFRFGELSSLKDLKESQKQEQHKPEEIENIPHIDETQPIISGYSILTLERALEFSATKLDSLTPA